MYGMNLIDQWNFIEREAKSLGVTKHAIQKWRERGRVPHKYRLPLLARAASIGVALSLEAFEAPPGRSVGA